MSTAKEPDRSTQFKPGQVGNPRGRPKGAKSLSDKYRRMLKGNKAVVYKDGKLVEIEMPKGYTVADCLAGVAIHRALRGSVAFLKEITDRAEGKVPVRVADANGNTLTAPITIVEVCGQGTITAALVARLGGPAPIETTGETVAITAGPTESANAENAGQTEH